MIPAAFAYIESGSGDEQTVRRNEEAFRDLVLFPRVLREVNTINMKRLILGK